MKPNKYQVVHRISEVIAQTSDPWVGLHRVTELITECVGDASCKLFAYSRKNGIITLVAAHGGGEELVKKFSFGIDEGLTGAAIKSGRILNIDDQASYQENVEMPENEEETPHGLLVVPLVVGGTTIGALDLTRTAKRKFSKQTLDMVDEIATPLAVFILNATLSAQNPEEDDAFSLLEEKKNIRKQSYSDKILKGQSITSGVVCGHTLLISGWEDISDFKRLPRPVNKTREAIEAEKKLLDDAISAAMKACQKTANQLQQTIAEADCDIFTMHAMLMDDPTIKKTILGYIEKGHSITTALTASLLVFTQQYMKIEDDYLRERLCDVKDVLLNMKNAADNLRSPNEDSKEAQAIFSMKRIIVVARELLPSQLVSLPLKNVEGIICEEGGSTSHVAILARALQKPMLVGVRGIVDFVNPGDAILLDCNAGRCYLKPTISMLMEYSEPLRLTRKGHEMSDTVSEPAEKCLTKDGQEITIAGNLALLSEIPTIGHYGLSEVGLYRTEFMFMMRNDFPSEDDQFAILKRMVLTAKVPVTVRILDAGGDKPLPYLNIWTEEENPALGWRGLRYLLSNPQILGPQLRAILRASAFGKVRILFPMVADLFDLLKAKEALAEAAAELKARGVAFDEKCEVGIMLEIPSAVVGIDTLLPHIDFASIGTNDLVQFLFAVDRGNPRLRQWYRQCHPVVLRSIRFVCESMSKYPEKELCLCGELAGSKRALPLLLGAGLRKLSMAPSRAPAIRQLVSKYSIDECKCMLDEVLQSCSTEMDVMAYLAKKVES